MTTPMFDTRLLLVGWALAAGGTTTAVSLTDVPAPPVAHMAVVAPAAVLPIAPAGAIEIERAADGLFYIDGLVNGASVRFLVDTGANVVVLTAADAERVGLSAGRSTGRGGTAVQTANGASSMTRVTLGHMTVAGREIATSDAAIAPSGLKVSLLGQNVLSKMGAVTLSGDRLIVHGTDKPFSLS